VRSSEAVLSMSISVLLLLLLFVCPALFNSHVLSQLTMGGCCCCSRYRCRCCYRLSCAPQPPGAVAVAVNVDVAGSSSALFNPQELWISVKRFCWFNIVDVARVGKKGTKGRKQVVVVRR
jgi:hypothetical protein